VLERADDEYQRHDYPAALRLYRDALSAVEGTGWPSLERARALIGMGNCYEMTAQKGKALTLKGKAVTHWHRGLAELRAAGQGASATALAAEGSIESYERHPVVFISYAHKDMPRLVQATVRVVRDEGDFRAGGPLLLEIDEVMDRCPNYLVFWSRTYAEREFTQVELAKVRDLVDPASPKYEPGRRAIIAAIDEEPLPSILGNILMISYRGAGADGLAEEIIFALTGVRPGR
jgi:hypothetical protein